MIQHRPQLSYTIWFTQRTGSTLLCEALADTGIAGRPGEWLLDVDPAKDRAVEVQTRIWTRGTTPNGVLGLKQSFYEPHVSGLLALFRRLPGAPGPDRPRPELWAHAFPHHRHIFMTRRNKVRLAVSWWRAIQSAEWHRTRGAAPAHTDLTDAYSFDAIAQLMRESVLREAGIQAFFSEGNITPLTLVYEDFIRDYAGTIHRVLDYLGVAAAAVDIPTPAFDRIADGVAERWVQRFREEVQSGWTHRGW